MHTRLGQFRVCAMCGVLMTALSGQAPNDASSPALKKAATCMLQVLKSTPGVDHANLGVSRNHGQAYPFLEYEASETARWTTPTRFDFMGSKTKDGRFAFQAILPGITTPDEDLDLHVTHVVVEKWEKQCGVSALILTI